MKAVYKILAVLLICALFVGCASAVTGFTESKTTATISPTGVLQVGDKVTATVTLYFPHDYPRATESLKFKTPLSGAGWKISTSDGEHILTYTTRNGAYADVPSYFINYDYPFQVIVEFSGSVPSTLAGKDINALTIEHLAGGDAVISSYISPKQFVYNTANFPSDIAARKASYSQIQSSIDSYKGTGVNTADAQNIASKAEENIIHAENFGLDNINNALASLDAADKNIASAKEALNYAILTYVANQIQVLNSDVNTLNALGANDKATMLSVSSNSLVMMYNSAVNTFKTDKTADFSALYESTISMKSIADSYIAAAQAEKQTANPTQTAVIPQPTQTTVVQPTQTAVIPQPTANPTANPTAYPTQSTGGSKITLTLDTTTMLLLIIIVVLVAGLVITLLLYKGAKSSGDSGRKEKKEKKGRDKDRWEEL
jgi:Predicted solute binding protein